MEIQYISSYEASEGIHVTADNATPRKVTRSWEQQARIKAEYWQTEVVNMYEKLGTAHVACEIQVLKSIVPLHKTYH